jgi:hypothetical protein
MLYTILYVTHPIRLTYDITYDIVRNIVYTIGKDLYQTTYDIVVFADTVYDIVRKRYDIVRLTYDID